MTADRSMLESYRLQARLLWEWRPARFAILRRTVLSYVMACLALAITAAVLAGTPHRRFPSATAGGAPAAGPGHLLRYRSQWLLVAQPIFAAQTLGLLVQVLAIIVAGRVVPGVGWTGM